MTEKKNLKAKLENLTKEEFDQWTSLNISRLFFGEFLDEIEEMIQDRKLNLPVDKLSDQEIASQMRSLAVVEIFIDNMRSAQEYETFIGTFDLGEEDED